MSGLAGVWNLDGRPAVPEVLARMSAALAHRGPDGEACRCAGPVGFAHRHLWSTAEEVGERQPLAGPGGTLLAFDGRLDNRAELIAALAAPRQSSDAGLALAAFGRWGERCAERLAGDFALAAWDPERRRLVLARDAIGLRPLYWFRGPRLFAFASEIKALLAHPEVPAGVDEEGLADYLLVSSRPVDRQEVTCFAGISSVVPAHRLVVTADRAAAERYWDFDRARVLRLDRFEAYVEAFGAHFAEAVRRRIRGPRPVAVSVSGGLDSSAILCQAETLRRRGRAEAPALAAISYTGTDAADERRYLAEIERSFEIAITRFPMAPLLGVVAGAVEQTRAIEAPFLDYLWGVTRRTHTLAREAGARVLLSGHWGDEMLFGPAYLADLLLRLDGRAARRHRRTWRRYFGAAEARALSRQALLDLARHLTPPPLAPLLKRARRILTRAGRAQPWLAEGFRRRGLALADRPVALGDGFATLHARALYLQARSKYHVHCMEWNNKTAAHFGLDAAFPFLDRDLVQFLMAVPGEIQNRNGVPRALLREAMRDILPEPVRARTWKADFTASANASVTADFLAIADLLSADSLAVARGYVDRARLAARLPALRAELRGPDALGTWELTDLFGLETWLRVFFSDGPTGAAGRRPATEGAHGEAGRRQAREAPVPAPRTDEARGHPEPHADETRHQQ